MKPEDILITLAGMHTWEDKCRADAKAQGMTSEADITAYVEEMDGDQPDDFLMNFHAEMKDMIEAAREALSPNPVAHLLNKTAHELGEMLVTSDLDLDADQKWRVLSLVFGEQHMDTDFAFEAQCEDHTLHKIHFQGTQIPGIHGGNTKIEGIDDLKFEDTGFIYLEGTDGRKFGWEACMPAQKHEWRFGLVFQDEEGLTWACAVDEPNALPHGETTGEEPLTLLEVGDTPWLNANNGPVDDLLPFEGEFYIEMDPETGTQRLGSISWSGPVNPDDPNIQADYATQLRAKMNRLMERAHEQSLQTEPEQEDETSISMEM
jgi:hypothetical protein